MPFKNENIVCISSIDWDFVWQGHQEIMSALAKAGNRVLFIENTGVRVPTLRDLPRLKKRLLNWAKGVAGIRKEEENLYVFSPIVVPFPYLRLARWINKHLLLSTLHKWMRVMDFDNPIIWVFLPTGLSLDLIESINKKLIVYYCIDKQLIKDGLKIKPPYDCIIKKSSIKPYLSSGKHTLSVIISTTTGEIAYDEMDIFTIL